jgi:ADP-ribose pyrophosphatase YjhB (NUDIX family)
MKRRIAQYIGLPLMRVYWKVWKPKTTGCKAIVVHDDKILLIKNLNKTYWSLPGGGKKKKETPESAIVRELKEELSIMPELTHKLGAYDARKEGKRDVVHVFVASVATPAFKKQWELSDAKWFSIEDFPPDMNEATKRRVLEYMEGKKEMQKEW